MSARVFPCNCEKCPVALAIVERVYSGIKVEVGSGSVRFFVVDANGYTMKNESVVLPDHVKVFLYAFDARWVQKIPFPIRFAMCLPLWVCE